MNRFLIYFTGLIVIFGILWGLVFQRDEAEEPLTQEVSVFFGNTIFDPLGLDCRSVFRVTRRVEGEFEIEKKSLEALLAGPFTEEKATGYISTINSRVSIRHFDIRDKVAHVDFDKTFEEGVAGSCRVIHIRSEIESTLMQFGTVHEVVISVEGRTEGVLQP